MIEISQSLLKQFEIKDIYKKDYIKIYNIYNNDFEFFFKTLSSFTKKINNYRLDDSSLSQFLNFYWKFYKICKSLPIAITDCVALTKKNSKLNIVKIKDIISVAYPDYEKEINYIVKKFNEYQNNRLNIFLDNNLNLSFNEKNLILCDSQYFKNTDNNKIKNKKFFLDPNFEKIKTITLLNPDLNLLQEIAYLNICDNLIVLNFGWLIRDYSNLNLFISNKQLHTRTLDLKYIDTPKPETNLANEFKGEIFEEDLELSSDLDEIYEILSLRNIEESNIDDIDAKNQNELFKVKSTLFQLSEGKIALLRNDKNFDQSQDVIEKSPLGKISIKSKKVDLIQQGEFVLFEGERATKLLEIETLNFEDQANHLYSDRKDWKLRLQQEINRLGLEKIISKIKEYGGRKTTQIYNIIYWLNPKSLRSKDKKTFFAIMKVCGLFNKAENIWLNMEKLEKAHRKAGRIIRKKIEKEITKNTKLLFEKGFQEYFLDDKESGSIEVYKIIEKGKSLKVKLSLTDKALLPGDL